MTRTPTQMTGNRQRLPENALHVCASCLSPRGNVRKGWTQITRNDQVIGWTCASCPTVSEPIRRDITATRVRFAARVNTTPSGDGKRRQILRTFDTLNEARSWVSEVRNGVQAAGGRAYVDPSRFTVREVCERWLERRQADVGALGGIREVTLNGYRSALHSLLVLMGDKVARDVTPDDVETALRGLAHDGGRGGRGMAHRSIIYALGSLRQAFNYGMRQKWLSTNVASIARAPRKHGADGGSRRAKRWTTSQLTAFRAHVDTYTYSAALAAEPWLVVGMLLTLCGMRRSEVMGLDWANIDLDAGTVTVAASRVKTGRGSATSIGEPKTANSRRTIQAETIHRGAARALRTLWLAQGRPEAGLVIVDAVGDPVHPDAYSRRFRALCEGAGVPYPGSIHNVRHSLATLLEEAAVPRNQAAALFGHDVATYLKFYVLADDEAAAEGAQALGRLFS